MKYIVLGVVLTLLPIYANANTTPIIKPAKISAKPQGYYTDWKISHIIGNSFFMMCHYKRDYISNATGKVIKTETMQRNQPYIPTIPSTICPKVIKSK